RHEAETQFLITQSHGVHRETNSVISVTLCEKSPVSPPCLPTLLAFPLRLATIHECEKLCLRPALGEQLDCGADLCILRNCATECGGVTECECSDALLEQPVDQRACGVELFARHRYVGLADALEQVVAPLVANREVG